MLNLDSRKVYMIQAIFKGSNPPFDTVATGEKVDSVINDIRNANPDFKKIVIYDADTKEAVGIIRE